MLDGHGDDLYRYAAIKANFSSNIYNGFNHKNLFNHLAKRLSAVASYPEPTPASLERMQAVQMGIRPEELCITNGATEAIYLIAQHFRRSQSDILQPTFAEYSDACHLHEHTVRSIFSLNDLHSNAQLLWLCNPNNPTGTVITKRTLLDSIKSHPQTLFVIDASYALYTLEPLLSAQEAVALSNVLMLHSMTKEYGIPGLRIGSVSGNATLIDHIRRQRMPWSVNQVAIEAGHYLLEHADEYIIPATVLIEERKRVAEALQMLGDIEVWPSDSNILLCRLRIGKTAVLKDWLAQVHGLLIRNASNFEGLNDSFFRIAVQTPEENDLLIHYIAEWLNR